MAVLSKGQTFATGDQVTALKLNDLVDDATFVAGAVDNASTQLSSGAIIVKDGGVTTAKLNDAAVTTAKILDANVTKAKIENLSDYTVLGNVSGGAAAPAEVSILDENDMASDSNTAIATQQSIKAYVDASSTSGFSPSSYTGGESVTLPNGLIMKFGTVTTSPNAVTTVTFGSAFTNTVNAQLTIEETGSADKYAIKINSLSVSALYIRNTSSANLKVHWMVIGR
jgi:hypothetical protein